MNGLRQSVFASVGINKMAREPKLATVLKALISHGLFQHGAVLDVGAHRGQEALMFSAWFPDKIIVAVDPIHSNYAQIVANKQKHDAWNIWPIRAALGSAEGVGHYNEAIDSGPPWAAQIGVPGFLVWKGHNTGVVAYKIKTVDSVLQMPVSFMHIDVEGSEIDVLQGAEQTIRRYHPILTVETHEKTHVKPFMLLMTYLRTRGYVCYEVLERCGVPECRNNLCVPNPLPESLAHSLPIQERTHEGSSSQPR